MTMHIDHALAAKSLQKRALRVGGACATPFRHFLFPTARHIALSAVRNFRQCPAALSVIRWIARYPDLMRQDLGILSISIVIVVIAVTSAARHVVDDCADKTRS